MASAARLIVQLMAYTAFVAFVGYFSASPAYDYALPDLTTIKLSLSHATERVEPCVRLTPEEVAKLAPNMRRTEICGRERLPMFVQVEFDGIPVVQVEAQPSGLWRDGPASVYERFEVPPGQHVITARMRDSKRDEGWDYMHEQTVMLRPDRNFTITFHTASGGFAFR